MFPAITGSGESALMTARSEAGSTTVPSVALSLAEVGSASVAATLAVLLRVPMAVGEMTIVTVAEAALEPIVLFDRGSSYYGLINSFFREAGVIPNVAMELDSLEATKRMVEKGLGVALVPLVTVTRELESGTLVKVDLVDQEPVTRPISLVTRANRKKPRAVQAFIESLESAYPVAEPVA